MPSNHEQRDTISRRRALAALGATITSGLAGCSGEIPGTGPDEVDVVPSSAEDRIVWEYPPTEDDSDGIGYAAVEFARRLHREQGSPAARIELNSTIGGIAASEPYRDYRLDWFRFRLTTPRAYTAENHLDIRVEPPGQWTGFSAYYDMQGGRWEFVVALRDVDTQGSIIVPVVLDPHTNTLPDKLWCSVAVQTSQPGVLGETVLARGDGRLNIPRT